MKKLMIALAVLGIAGFASADLLDGTFTGIATNSGTALNQDDAGELDQGWFVASTGFVQPTGTEMAWTRPDATATYSGSIGQIWSDTLTGNQQLTFDFTLLDIADLTTPTLHIEILAVDAGGFFRNGFPANDNLVTSISEWAIDLTTQSVGTYTSSAINFTPTAASSYYGIRMSFEVAADGGGADNIAIDNVSIVPEPATVGMLGLGALVSLLVRRIRG
jgi:hypothetical protein